MIILSVRLLRYNFDFGGSEAALVDFFEVGDLFWRYEANAIIALGIDDAVVWL